MSISFSFLVFISGYACSFAFACFEFGDSAVKLGCHLGVTPFGGILYAVSVYVYFQFVSM